MKNSADYLFTSKRIGFRSWNTGDVISQAKINADPKVMEFFPATQSIEQTAAFIERMQKLYDEKGYCYFAIDKLDNREHIGFLGINWQTFESDFTPCVDIGWRIKSSEWNKGYATEGGLRCLEYAFIDLKIDRVHSIASKVNVKSIKIMQNIGMKKMKEFVFPALKDDLRLKDCMLYYIDNLPSQ